MTTTEKKSPRVSQSGFARSRTGARIRIRALLPAGLLICCLSFVLPSAAAGNRFEGYVGGAATGKGHHFVVGDGINLVFVDRTSSFTSYRVCWHRLHHHHRRCWDGETGPEGRPDRIFTAAPSFSGVYIVQWSVGGHRRAQWRFYNGVGD